MRAPICAALAKVVQEERHARGLSVYALAKLTGLASRTIRFLEGEDSAPNLDTLARIADVFGIRPGRLLDLAQVRVTPK